MVMLGATLSIVPWTLDFRSEDFGWNLSFCCTLHTAHCTLHTALCSGQSVTKCKSKCRLCYFLGNVTLDQAGPRSIKCFLNLKKKSILLKRKSWAELSLLLLFTSSCVTQDKTSDLKEKPSVKKGIVTRHCCRKDNVLLSPPKHWPISHVHNTQCISLPMHDAVRSHRMENTWDQNMIVAACNWGFFSSIIFIPHMVMSSAWITHGIRTWSWHALETT